MGYEEGSVPFWIEYAGVMGLHLIGAVLNGFIALLYIFGGRHMLADRIDKIVLGLLVICCLWSIATNARLFVDLSYPDASLGSITGATSSIVITLLVGANVLLAMERYFISRGTSPSASAKYHIASMSFSSLLCAVIIGVFATSPSKGGTWPDDRPQYFIWLGSVLTGFSVASVIIVYSYTSTFFFLRSQLELAMANQRVDKWRTVMQRRLLINSIMMSASLVVLYTPQICSFAIFGAKVLSPSSPDGLLLSSVSFFFLTLDVVATPLLILYFLNPVTRYRTGRSYPEEETESESSDR